MNLWGNRVGQLAVLAVALFFFSCEDETSLLGYKNPTTKFEVSFVDIPLETSVLLLDSVRSSNYDATNDINRWLVGKYLDPRFGEITASPSIEFYPLNSLRIDSSKVNDVWVKDIPEFDSISLKMKNDFYVYGANGKTDFEIAVHELTEKLIYGFNKTVTTNTGGQQKPQITYYPFPRIYFAQTTTTYDPTEIGSKLYKVDFDQYNTEIDDATPDHDKAWQNMFLDQAFGQRIFDLALNRKDSFNVRSFFTKNFKGLTFVPKQADKIIGMSPDSTHIELHYHNKKDTLVMQFTLGKISTSGSTTVSYSTITANRGGSEVQDLTEFYEETDLGTDLRYVQAGTGIVTKIDFSKFFEFADTIERLAINSAELKIKSIEDPGYFAPPPTLLVQIVENNNRSKKLTYPGKSNEYTKDRDALTVYRGTVNYNTSDISNYYYALRNVNSPFDSAFNIVNDIGSFFALRYSKDDKNYKGTAALFFQQLFAIKDDEDTPRMTQAILLPYGAPTNAQARGIHILGKSLNRVAFHKDNIVLRVYYTVPTVK